MEKINLDNIKELKIEVALNKFNEKKGFKAMSKSKLSKIVLKGNGLTEKANNELMSAWINGKRYSSLRPKYIKRIANALEVTTDFLLNN